MRLACARTLPKAMGPLPHAYSSPNSESKGYILSHDFHSSTKTLSSNSDSLQAPNAYQAPSPPSTTPSSAFSTYLLFCTIITVSTKIVCVEQEIRWLRHNGNSPSQPSPFFPADGACDINPTTSYGRHGILYWGRHLSARSLHLRPRQTLHDAAWRI